VSPRVIYLEDAEAVNYDGRTVALQRSVVDRARCIGCGLCRHMSTVHDQRAIQMFTVGGSRSEFNVLILE